MAGEADQLELSPDLVTLLSEFCLMETLANEQHTESDHTERFID